jgi:hypothetical protein
MVVIIWILKGIAALVISWGIAFCFSMFFFWIDLEINDPDTTGQIDVIKQRHLRMNKYLHISILICLFFFL